MRIRFIFLVIRIQAKNYQNCIFCDLCIKQGQTVHRTEDIKYQTNIFTYSKQTAGKTRENIIIERPAQDIGRITGKFSIQIPEWGPDSNGRHLKFRIRNPGENISRVGLSLEKIFAEKIYILRSSKLYYFHKHAARFG